MNSRFLVIKKKKQNRLIKKKIRFCENRGCLDLARKHFKIHLYFQMRFSLTYSSNTLYNQILYVAKMCRF